MLPSETPGLTSPNAVLETMNSVAAIEPGSCEVKREVTKNAVPTTAANNSAESPSRIELLVPGLIKSNK